MARKARGRVFSKGQGQKRQRGNPRRVVTFRPPEDIEAYIREVASRGYSQSEVVFRALRIGKDAAEALGAEWWELERRANVEGVSVGTVLGRLAAEALEKSGGRRK